MKKIWSRVSNFGVTQDADIESTRKIILLNQIAILLSFLIVTIRTTVLISGVEEFSPRVLFPFFAGISILSIPFFNKRGNYKHAAFALVFMTPLLSIFMITFTQLQQDLVDINYYYYPRFLLMAELFLPLILIHSKHKISLILAILNNILCILFFDVIVDFFGLQFNVNHISFSNYELINYMIIVPILLIIGAIVFLIKLNKNYEQKILGLNKYLTENNDELEDLNEELTLQQDIIMKKNEELEIVTARVEQINKDLTSSIMYAERIQDSILDKQSITEGFFSDSFILFKPKSIVSGDFYYYKNTKINNESCIVVAAVDCTGHGVPGGFLSMLGITLLNEIISSHPIQNAASILNELRSKIKSILKQTGKDLEQKDGMDMALCIYNPNLKLIEYAGAKNPLCILSNEGELQLIRGDRQPIGIYENEKTFTNHTISVENGDMLYMFSDGIIDQFGGEYGKKLMIKNLTDTFQEISSFTCAEQKIKLINFLNNWQYYKDDLNEQIDDIVLIGMKI